MTEARAQTAPNREVRAARAEHPPSTDGRVDETWANATAVSEFHQREPFEGRLATEKTVVRVLYDRHNLYFAFEGFDSEPRRIVATELRRDTDFTVDDYVSIMISPNNDARGGYVFTTNPLGTQFDALIANEGQINDPNWDAVWKSNASFTPAGWSATIAIPFSTLNFKTSADVTVGLNFRRFIRRKNEEDPWQSYLRIYGLERVSEGGRFYDFQVSPRPKTGPVRGLDFEGFYSRQPDTHGVLQTQEWQATFRALFHNGSYTDDDLFDNFIQRLAAPFNIFRNVFIPAGIYHFDRHQFTYGSDLSKRWFIGFFERFGTYYNGTLNEARIRASYRPTAKISLAAVETWDRFRLGERLYNVHIGSLSSSYSFNRFLTTSILAQVNTIEKNPVSANFRLRYTYRPDSDVFVIYNLGSQFNSIAAGNPVLLREQRLTVKFTYSFLR
jgi:hypothetical protein